MITSIVLNNQGGVSWLPASKTNNLDDCLQKATERAVTISREYLRASNILDFLKNDHGVGSIETRLRNLPWGKELEVNHYSGVKRAFIIGILTITEED